MKAETYAQDIKTIIEATEPYQFVVGNINQIPHENSLASFEENGCNTAPVQTYRQYVLQFSTK